jgi:hypothetical protein
VNRRIVFGAVCLFAASIACTFTQSLDYLQAGSAPGDDGGADVTNGEGGPVFPPPVVIAGAQKVPSLLAEDADNLYWTDSDRAAWKVAKAGGTAQAIGIFGGTPTKLAADPRAGVGFLFAIVGATVQRLSKAGGSAPETILAGPPAPQQITADSLIVFVAQKDQADNAGIIVRAAEDGGARTTLATGQDPKGLALAGPHVLWFNDDEVNAGVSIRALDKTSDGGGLLTYVPPDPQALSLAEVSSMVADTEAVYVASDEYQVDRLLRSPTAVTTTLVDSVDTGEKILAVAVDSQFAYVTDSRPNGNILRVPKTGGPVVKMAQGLPTPTSIVVDTNGIYFLVIGVGLNDGAVMRLSKN